MDSPKTDEKYKKLATEYSKIRAQASVLKRAVLEEQNKNSVLRESLRTKETALRRAEQEVDSLGFRNKQLEHRVASLQDDLNKENSKKLPKNTNKTKSKANTNPTVDRDLSEQSSVFSEELQKKILESAQLASMVADKTMEIQMQTTRIEELERALDKFNFEQAEKDTNIRKEMERLVAKNHDLEAKLADACSIVSSDDTIYVSECEQHQHQQLLNNNNNNVNSNGNNTSTLDTNEDRILTSEKEMVFWRTQYEILKISTKVQEEIERKGDNEKWNENDEKTGMEQLINNHFSVKIEDLFMKKSMAESKLSIYIEECNSLQKHLEILNSQMKNLERKLKESQGNLRLTDEDLATTRINYEEQISVLTEQVISLSDQLANLK